WLKVLDFVESDTEETKALRAFATMDSAQLKADLERAVQPDVIKALKAGGLCVLKYAPTGQLFHQMAVLKSAWEKKFASDGEAGSEPVYMTCLITGEQVPESRIARLHPNIKNVAGAQSSGAALVSFNKDAFCSYGL